MRRRLPAALTSLVVWLATVTAGCSILGDDEPAEQPAASAQEGVVEALEAALRQRAAAVRRGDRSAFVRGLAARPALRRSQLVWFDNLAQLPVGRLGYRVDAGTLVREGEDYWMVVEQRLQLEGFDDEPVATPDRFRFAPAGGGRFVVASVSDPGWEERNGVRPDPWDLGPVEVVTAPGVLGVFDAGSAGAAPSLLAAVERGLTDVAAAVPLEWPRSVVVYALSDTRFLSTIGDLPGGDPEQVDAVAFPVWSELDDQRPAATRIVFHPRMLGATGRERERLIRHELVHVAVGERDDRAPVWLSEGLAEYVSVRPLAPQDRVVSAEALHLAAEGTPRLPSDAGFNEGGSAANYGLSWWACEYLARNYGEPVLWSLLETLARPGVDEDEALRSRFGLGAGELAEQAAALMLAAYGMAGGAAAS
ncbi:hypothetical protein [Nocardioides ferulae]|uniref:hypothetical protein n=1 Tax=Nocardioides ferulae TaxID=2340821 RepID=UPI000EACDFFC|nr:hypothetical protein [Nocardioides ferulae]